jgi:hypothetical protein
VILDTDLAKIYGVETRALNQALKRNQARFPDDFVFELTREEILGIPQTVISLRKLKFSKQVRALIQRVYIKASRKGVGTARPLFVSKPASGVGDEPSPPLS